MQTISIMSRAGSTTNLPSTTTGTHKSVASDAAAPLQVECLSEDTTPCEKPPQTISENVIGSEETLASDANHDAPRQGEHLSKDTTEKVPQTRTENVSEETSDANVLWVDWDGPEDPMNPKKWVVRLLFVKLVSNDPTT
jgi:hypothetical protein